MQQLFNCVLKDELFFSCNALRQRSANCGPRGLPLWCSESRLNSVLLKKDEKENQVQENCLSHSIVENQKE